MRLLPRLAGCTPGKEGCAVRRAWHIHGLGLEEERSATRASAQMATTKLSALITSGMARPNVYWRQGGRRQPAAATSGGALHATTAAAAPAWPAPFAAQGPRWVGSRGPPSRPSAAGLHSACSCGSSCVIDLRRTAWRRQVCSPGRLRRCSCPPAAAPRRRSAAAAMCWLPLCGVSLQHTPSNGVNTPRTHADLLSLTDELLLAVLHRCGAPAVARCATLCKRLHALQGQLAALPAFASAAMIEGAEEQ